MQKGNLRCLYVSNVIATQLQATVAYNLTGLNVDWEPTTAATEQDAQDYANFLNNVCLLFVGHTRN